MSEEASVSRRHFLTVATSVTGVVGLALTAAPFIASFRPSTRAQALGAPVAVDISKLDEGAMVRVCGAASRCGCFAASKVMLERLAGRRGAADGPGVERIDTACLRQECNPGAAARVPRRDRQLHPSGLRADRAFRSGADADLGADWVGGFFCPCHGSKFDLAGRVMTRRRRHRPTWQCRLIASWETSWSLSVKTREPAHEHGTHRARLFQRRQDGPLHRLDRRALPADGDDEGACHRVLRRQEFQCLVRVRRAGPGGAGPSARSPASS